MERRIETAWLLDFYGPLLTQRQQTLLRAYVDEDLSLAEIAAQEGISRQGVHDAIRRGEQQLTHWEGLLGLLARYRRLRQGLTGCREALDKGSPEALREARALIQTILNDEEGYDGL